MPMQSVISVKKHRNAGFCQIIDHRTQDGLENFCTTNCRETRTASASKGIVYGTKGPGAPLFVYWSVDSRILTRIDRITAAGI